MLPLSLLEMLKRKEAAISSSSAQAISLIRTPSKCHQKRGRKQANIATVKSQTSRLEELFGMELISLCDFQDLRGLTSMGMSSKYLHGQLSAKVSAANTFPFSSGDIWLKHLRCVDEASVLPMVQVDRLVGFFGWMKFLSRLASET